jgi:hypothetical protein
MEKKEDAVVPHGPHMAHMTRECPAIAAIRGGGRTRGQVAPAHHGLVSIVTARCGLRAGDEPCFADKKGDCPLAAQRRLSWLARCWLKQGEWVNRVNDRKSGC